MTVGNSFIPKPGSRFAPRLDQGFRIPRLSDAAQQKGWTNTENTKSDRQGKGRNKKKKTYTEEQKKAYSQKKNKKRRDKAKEGRQALETQSSYIKDLLEGQQKMIKEVKKHGRTIKLSQKDNIEIKQQTKKRTPQKRPQKPREEGKKDEIDLKKYKKVILIPK